MKLRFERKYHSIDGPVTNEELPDFIVLSGLNGSGKSNLLESIEAGATAVEGIPTDGSNPVRLFRLAQFVAAGEDEYAPAGMANNWLPLASTVKQAIEEFARAAHYQPSPQSVESFVENKIVNQNRMLTERALGRACRSAGKPITEFDDEDFRTYLPVLLNVRDPFNIAIGELFTSYHARRNKNDYIRYLVDVQGRNDVRPLSDDDFVHLYGSPPWDVLGATLQSVGLRYSFEPPRGVEEHLTYRTRLLDDETGLPITTDRLSSGEKTLLAVAMTLYTGSNLAESIELPRLLLLDEADASLHPSMVHSLIKVTRDVIVGQHGVKVILTTHSPSTVALAPENSLHSMSKKGDPRLTKTTRDQALSELTAGLSALSVRAENRRQIFVESEHDEDCYQEVYRHVKHRVNAAVSLEFIASGRGGQGNSDAVKHLVSHLRQAGNTSVWGILDRDRRGGTGEGIVFNRERHSLENLVLDPLALGCFLVREGLANPDSLGLQPDARHLNWTSEDRIAVISSIVHQVQEPADDATPTEVKYAGGFSHLIPRFYLDMKGHDLHDRLTRVHLPLRKYRASLSFAVASKVFGDIPDYVPMSAIDTFRELVG